MLLGLGLHAVGNILIKFPMGFSSNFRNCRSHFSRNKTLILADFRVKNTKSYTIINLAL